MIAMIIWYIEFILIALQIIVDGVSFKQKYLHKCYLWCNNRLATDSTWYVHYGVLQGTLYSVSGGFKQSTSPKDHGAII